MNTRPSGAQDAPPPSGRTKNVLKGFIVSDSHFGWRNEQQPPVEKQREMIAAIMKRFPDLDVFLDTGDAHHNYATAEDRGHWTETIAGGCGRLPFYFLAGNHDVDAWGYDWDPEQDSMRLGSLPCRPYFSFDFKNIHFLAIPELMSVSTVTDEVLAWARLDLALNKEKKVIVLSHNALAGTTVPRNDSTYRVVTNSNDVFKLLDENPNVLAWMHGHNHDYNLVPKDNRLYVSNGRIGGFIPKDSTNAASNQLNAPLGGIYFEVHPEKFVVRCYSAEHDKFLDELPGGSSLAHTMRLPTMLNGDAPPGFSFGMALMPPGTKMPVHNYHASTSNHLFLQNCQSGIINQNSALDQYSVRVSGASTARNLEGYTLRPDFDPNTNKAIGYVFDNPGITILPTEGDKKPFLLSIPGQARGRRGYYRGRPGSTVDLEIDWGKVPPGARCHAVLNIATTDTKERGSGAREEIKLPEGNRTSSCAFQLPGAGDTGIYSDAESDYVISFWIDLRFGPVTGPLELKGIRIRARPLPGGAEQPILQLGEEHFDGANQAPTKESVFAFAGLSLDADRLVATNLSAKPINWLMRIEPLWQSRNAPLSRSGQIISINRRTNSFGANKEVILAPMGVVATPYVHRLTGICPADIHLFDDQDRSLKVNVKKIDGAGLVTISTTSKPKKMVNAELVCETEGGFVAKATATGMIAFYF